MRGSEKLDAVGFSFWSKRIWEILNLSEIFSYFRWSSLIAVTSMINKLRLKTIQPLTQHISYSVLPLIPYAVRSAYESSTHIHRSRRAPFPPIVGPPYHQV